MNYYRCENPDCGFLAEEEPDVCPQCGGTFFLSVDEEELTGPDWVQLGNRAVDEERPTDALACYQQAAALDDMLGVTNLGWCLEAGIGVPADPRQAVVLYAQAAALSLPISLTGTLGYAIAGWNVPELPSYSVGFVYLPGMFCLLVSSMSMAVVGARLAHSPRLPMQVLRRCFAVGNILLGLSILRSVLFR